MRFLLDANLSPRLVEGLGNAGYSASHVDQVGLLGASDVAIFDHAARDGLVVITADSDFSAVLAARGSQGPSVILLRHVSELGWQVHEALLVDNLPSVFAHLKDGAVVSLSPTRLAVRRLPIESGTDPLRVDQARGEDRVVISADEDLGTSGAVDSG